MTDDTPPASPAEPTERERLYEIAKAGGNWYAAAKPLPDEAFDAIATPPASPAATDEEVARVVKRLTSGNAGWADLCQAADLLVRLARERDIAQEAWQHEHERAEKAKAMIKHMVGISDDMATVFIDGFGDVALDYDDARLKRAEAAEKLLCDIDDDTAVSWVHEAITAHLAKHAGGNNG